MSRTMVIPFAAFAILFLSASPAFADDPVKASLTPGPGGPGAAATGTVPSGASTPVLTVTSSQPITATNGTTTSSGTPAAANTTTVTGPGTSVTAPVGGSASQRTPGAPTAPDSVPSGSASASAPIDTTGTAIDPGQQTIAARSDGTSGNGSVSDPSSAGFQSAFCVLARSNELSGPPSADVSTFCGNAPSTASSTAVSDAAGTGTGSGTGGLNGSACLSAHASGQLPAAASASSACGANTPSTVSGSGNAAGSNGTTITPEMVGSLCLLARASATLPGTAEFATVCGGSSATTATAPAADVRGSQNAPASGGTTPSVSAEPAHGVLGFELPGLPSTSTAGLSILGTLMLVGGLALLRRRRAS